MSLGCRIGGIEEVSEFIDFHLSNMLMASEGPVIVSSFTAALRDARHATGRDEVTGKVSEWGKQGNWLGAIGYLLLLDQIGTSFKRKDAPALKCPSIIRALQGFSSISNRLDMEALYALRCALAHDFSVININREHPERTHHFLLTGALDNSPGPVVRRPSQPWDGDYATATEENATVINLHRFGDLVEATCTILRDLAAQDHLEVALKGGDRELQRRYSIGIF